MYDIHKDIDVSISRLMPNSGTVYLRIFNSYISAGLIYNELNHLGLLNDIHYNLGLGTNDEFNQREELVAKLLGMWYLRILANIGKVQFEAFIAMHPQLSHDPVQLGLALYKSTHKVIKPKVMLSNRVRAAIQAVHFNESNKFVIDNKTMHRPAYRHQYLIVTNVINTTITTINVNLINDILEYLESNDNLAIEDLKPLKTYAKELHRIDQIDKNRLHAIYTPFYHIVLDYISTIDPTYISPKSVNTRLKLLKG